jgi:hypothetical protein
MRDVDFDRVLTTENDREEHFNIVLLAVMAGSSPPDENHATRGLNRTWREGLTLRQWADVAQHHLILCCSFCKRSEDEAAQLVVASPEQAICEECVGLLVSIIAEKNKEWRDRQIEALTKLQ